MGEGTENDDPASIFMRRVIDGASEYERNLIKTRTKTALQAKRRRGERVGTIPYGYALSNDAIHLLPVPKEQEAIRLMQDLRDRGFSYRKIGRHLESMQIMPPKAEQWAPETIKQLILRPPVPCEPCHAS